ncbi:MAG: hypothetical protein QXU40_01475 [Candidatus Pacearchaeota archaeon]
MENDHLGNLLSLLDSKLNKKSVTKGIQCVLDGPDPDGMYQIRLMWHPGADYPPRPDEIFAEADSPEKAIENACIRILLSK